MILRQALTLGGGGALVLAAVELATLATARPGVWWLTATVLALLGLAVAATAAAAELAIARFSLRPWGRALVRASGAIVALAPVGAHLFDGGFASTLPGASWAPLWVPLCGWLALAAALALGERWLGEGAAAVPALTARRRWAALALLLLVVAGEVANRRYYRTQYLEVHRLLTIVACVGAGLALSLGLGGRRRTRVRLSRLGLAVAAVLVAAGAVAVIAGPLDRDTRWVVATRGTHSRLLLGLLRRPPPPTVSPGSSPALATPPPPPPAAAPVVRPPGLGDHHLLLLLVDALRADVTRPTPENRRDFPHLLRFLDGARRFRRAFAPAAGTDLSVSTIVTSRTDPFVPIPVTLAEALRQHGRSTYGVFPSEVLRWLGTTLVTRGYERWDRLVTDAEERDTSHHPSGPRTTDLGLAELRRAGAAGRPLFLWLHYFDVHEHGDLEATDPALGAALVRMGGAADGAEAARRLRGDAVLKYRAAVALFDHELGRLEAALDEQRLRERTIVVLASDHGESLGEDPRLPSRHGDFLYQPLIHVPLALRLPGVAPADLDNTVSLVDVMPTLLDLLGAPPLPGLEGRSQAAPLLEARPGGDPTPRVVALNESQQRGLIRWPHKLLLRPADELVELYDLAADPGEGHDLSEQEPALLGELSRILRSLPTVKVDRSRHGRRQREQAAQAPGAR